MQNKCLISLSVIGLSLLSRFAAAEPQLLTTDWAALVNTKGPYVLQAHLAAPAAKGKFGGSTAIWHDDAAGMDWAVVGAPLEDGNSGAVYVFTHASGESEWHQEIRLTPDDPTANSAFGYSVAIDHNVVVVGAPAHEADFFVGAVYVFARDPMLGVWLQQGLSIVGPETGFGAAVTINGDLLAASALQGDAVRTFALGGGSWWPFATITAPSEMVSPSFGQSLAINATHLLVGAPGDSKIAAGQGSAALYSLTRDGWDLVQILRPTSETAAHQRFGYAVAMTSDLQVVGAPGAPGGGTAYVFGDPWASMSIELFALHGTGTTAGFGTAVAAGTDLFAVTSANDDMCDVFHQRTWDVVHESTLRGDHDTFFGSSAAVAGNEIMIGAMGATATADGDAYAFLRDRIFADDVE